MEDTETTGVDIMTIEEWNGAVSCGGFTPYDGIGFYGTATKEDIDLSVWEIPSHWLISLSNSSQYTHVHWYNK